MKRKNDEVNIEEQKKILKTKYGDIYDQLKKFPDTLQDRYLEFKFDLEYNPNLAYAQAERLSQIQKLINEPVLEPWQNNEYDVLGSEPILPNFLFNRKDIKSNLEKKTICLHAMEYEKYWRAEFNEPGYWETTTTEMWTNGQHISYRYKDKLTRREVISIYPNIWNNIEYTFRVNRQIYKIPILKSLQEVIIEFIWTLKTEYGHARE